MEHLPKTKFEAKRRGLKYYFTGEPCKNGHVSKRYISGNCVECKSMQMKEYNKKYVKANRDKVAAYHKKYYEDNKDSLLAYRSTHGKQWRKDNPMEARARSANRLAALNGCEGELLAPELEMIYKEQGGKCGGCYVELTEGFHLDHIEPLALGGSNTPDNIQFLCAPCNCSKRHTPAREWIKKKIIKWMY